MPESGEPFDPNDETHRAWRQRIAQLLGLEVDLRDEIDLTEVDLTEKRAEAS